MTWDELIADIQTYVDSLTDEEMARIYKELNVHEYATPFGIIRYIPHKLTSELESHDNFRYPPNARM